MRHTFSSDFFRCFDKIEIDKFTNMRIEKIRKLELFRQEILNRYTIYNSLFTNLQGETYYAGILIPLLYKLCIEKFPEEAHPEEIIEHFFEKHTNIKTSKERFNLLFKIVQYVERQIVLFDCIEDAAFTKFEKRKLKNALIADRRLSQPKYQYLEDFSVRLVFTAHPTQFYPRQVQDIMHELRNAISRDHITQVDTLLRQLGFTPFLNKDKPTPFEEANNIVYYLRYVYYDSIGQLYKEICELMEKEPDFNPNMIELGFWPGGDRDGNPFVTQKVTLQVARLLRNAIMKCYYHHVKWLGTKITFKRCHPIILALQQQLYKQIFTDEVIIQSQEILDKLFEIRELVKDHYQHLYLSELNDLIGRILLFGCHFATLDIRQDSGIHRQVLREIFRVALNRNLDEIDHSKLIQSLAYEKQVIDPNAFDKESITYDTLVNIRQIKQIQHENGPKSIHRYIISNTESEIDIWTVFALFKWSGYEENDFNIDIVPLFETILGMEASLSIMESMFKHPIYRSHLQRRGDQQTIMLGFSDGTKDGGYLKSNVSIYQTKKKLRQLANSYGIELIFFDGRGGPPARGGGKTHQFYAAQGREINGKQIQLTIQGQTITSIYGTKEHTAHHVEQLLMAGFDHGNSLPTLSKEQEDTLNTLTDISYRKYTNLKNHPKFIDYLEKMTTLPYYGETNIGSRPVKRGLHQKLTLKDLRAIPFVSAWSLLRQNIPGYYGLGTALEHFANDFEKVQNLYQSSYFFKTLIHNSMMALKKTYFPLTSYMKNDPEFGEFWQDLRSEYLKTKLWTLKLSGESELMENEPNSRSSISVREHIILPLLCIQQYALHRIRMQDPESETYKKLVIRCMFGNINASRNSV